MPGEVEAPAVAVEPVPAGAEGTTPVDAGPGESSFSLNDSIMGEGDLDEVALPQADSGAQAPAAEQPAEAAAPQGTQPPAKPGVQPTAPTAATPAATPAQPTASAPSPPSTPVPQPGGSPTNLSEELAKNRDVLIDHLAQTRFALTPAEKEALETDAIGAIPRLVARAYYEAATTSLNQINNMVPRLIEHVTAELRTTNEAEDAFYREWPAISRTDAAHAQAVNVAANIFRSSNPQASRADAIKAVGSMVSAMLGLQAPPAARPNGNGSAPSRPPAARPFTPASGAARVTSAIPVPDAASPWAGIGQEFD